ncbi:MAG: class I SAM-dependent methyltransferase [Devosia nanyangense]|uniref:Class I SAM-dependent methyltransferase n=1 Tax=Devosia nanyangense TaxID=1228055 RepID=A0A933L1U2_9HYPH|nr:class I SAM-dependent methyltransferase [Devosia nanyangense]
MNWLFRRPSLMSLAKERASTRNASSKPDHYYEKYERYFEQLRGRTGAVAFEIGVFEGESTKILSRYLPDARVVGVDLKLRKIDLRGYPNVRLYQGDQTDAAFLQGLAAEHAPNGIDLVIDDASHIGDLSRRTFEVLFPRLKSGGLYVVEDWGTGYWPKWPSGHDFQPVQVEESRIRSHDYGMVGFVKSLIDNLSPGDTHLPAVAELHVFPGTAILRKA